MAGESPFRARIRKLADALVGLAAGDKSKVEIVHQNSRAIEFSSMYLPGVPYLVDGEAGALVEADM